MVQMPLEVAEMAIIKEYIESAPACRIFYRVDGNHVRIMAGQLTWTDKLSGDAREELIEWLHEKEKESKGRVIEVKGWRNTQEVFG